MSKDSFLASLAKSGAVKSVVEAAQEVKPTPLPDEVVPVPNVTVVDTVGAFNEAAAGVKKATGLISQATEHLSSMSAMACVALLTKASKDLKAASDSLSDAASAEFNARIAEDPTAQKIIVGDGVFSRNSDSTKWKYSPAIAALQAEEKKSGAATSTIVKAKQSYKLSV